MIHLKRISSCLYYLIYINLWVSSLVDSRWLSFRIWSCSENTAVKKFEIKYWEKIPYMVSYQSRVINQTQKRKGKRKSKTGWERERFLRRPIDFLISLVLERSIYNCYLYSGAWYLTMDAGSERKKWNARI